MKKIGLLSDTHGYVDEKVFHYFEAVDEIWHAGDVGSLEVIDSLKAFKPLVGVYGNIDDHKIRLELPEYQNFQCENLPVLMTHIGGKPERYSQRALTLIEQYRPKLFVCGHSHILLVKKDKRFDMLWMNPGACGIKGFHKVQTLLRFDINDTRILNLEAIEIGYRG